MHTLNQADPSFAMKLKSLLQDYMDSDDKGKGKGKKGDSKGKGKGKGKKGKTDQDLPTGDPSHTGQGASASSASSNKTMPPPSRPKQTEDSRSGHIHKSKVPENENISMWKSKYWWKNKEGKWFTISELEMWLVED
jgi:hypothetical protein